MGFNKRDYTNSSIENIEMFFLMSEAYKMEMISKTEYQVFIKECLDALMGEESN